MARMQPPLHLRRVRPYSRHGPPPAAGLRQERRHRRVPPVPGPLITLSPYPLISLSPYLLNSLSHSLRIAVCHPFQPEPEHAASQDQPGPGSLNPYFKYAANLFENYGFVTVSTLALLAGACRPTVVSLIYGVLACCVAFLRKRTIFTGWRCIMIILALYVTLQYSFLLIGELSN